MRGLQVKILFSFLYDLFSLFGHIFMQQQQQQQQQQ
jgi:hypothetical protein